MKLFKFNEIKDFYETLEVRMSWPSVFAPSALISHVNVDTLFTWLFIALYILSSYSSLFYPFHLIMNSTRRVIRLKALIISRKNVRNKILPKQIIENVWTKWGEFHTDLEAGTVSELLVTFIDESSFQLSAIANCKAITRVNHNKCKQLEEKIIIHITYQAWENADMYEVTIDFCFSFWWLSEWC